jgi:hypothetical protein
MDSWLPFLSTLIWQIIVIIGIFLFRSELLALLKRVARLKHGETEVFFQEASTKALDPSPVATEALKLRDEEGFFTLKGIEELILKSKYIESSESLLASFLVFRTPSQHTWLVATNKQVFFVLDDEHTRANQRLIQYRLSLEKALPVDTEQESARLGVFQLGESDWWYYSIDLLGKSLKARQRLEVFVQTAMG